MERARLCSLRDLPPVARRRLQWPREGGREGGWREGMRRYVVKIKEDMSAREVQWQSKLNHMRN